MEVRYCVRIVSSTNGGSKSSIRGVVVSSLLLSTQRGVCRCWCFYWRRRIMVREKWYASQGINRVPCLGIRIPGRVSFSGGPCPCVMVVIVETCCRGHRCCVVVVFVMGRGRFVVGCRVVVVVVSCGHRRWLAFVHLTRIACISNSTSPHIYIVYIRTHPCLKSAWCCFSCLRVFVLSRAFGYAWCCFRSCIYFLVRCFYFSILFCCMYVCLLYTLPFSFSNWRVSTFHPVKGRNVGTLSVPTCEFSQYWVYLLESIV